MKETHRVKTTCPASVTVRSEAMPNCFALPFHDQSAARGPRAEMVREAEEKRSRKGFRCFTILYFVQQHFSRLYFESVQRRSPFG